MFDQIFRSFKIPLIADPFTYCFMKKVLQFLPKPFYCLTTFTLPCIYIFLLKKNTVLLNEISVRKGDVYGCAITFPTEVPQNPLSINGVTLTPGETTSASGNVDLDVNTSDILVFPFLMGRH